MRNKKAWLRIVEAVIAILIVTSALIIVATRTPKQDSAESIQELQRNILEQISSKEELRAEILQNKTTNTSLFVKGVLPAYYNFTIKICEVNEQICSMPYYIPKDVYANEILISSTLEEFKPKRLKLFVWKK